MPTDPYSVNEGTYGVDRDQAAIRATEVPNGTWTDPVFLAASCSPGIGVASGDHSYDFKVQDWDRNNPDPEETMYGSVIGGHFIPGFIQTDAEEYTPTLGGSRVAYVQNLTGGDVLPGEQIGGVGVFAMFNNSDRTVAPGEWIFAEGIFEAAYSWDFALEEGLPPEMTFTRASEANYVNSAGRLVAAAVNEPRIEYDLNGNCLGLLVEGAKDNEALGSEDFAEGPWLEQRIGATWIRKYAAISPTGNIDAQEFIQANEGIPNPSRKWRYQHISGYVSGDVITLSIHLKRNATALTYATLNVCDFSETDRWAAINYNCGTSTIESTAASGTNWAVLGSGTNELADSWVEVWMAAAVGDILGDLTIGLALKRTDVYTEYGVVNYDAQGSPDRSFFTYGFQAERNSFTSYVPSINNFVSRASQGTYIGSTGLIETALGNVERFTYSPVDLSLPPEQLIEVESTNEFPYSELIGQLARYPNTTINTDLSQTDPTGTSNGRYIRELATNDKCGVYYDFTPGDSTVPACFSAFVKVVTGTAVDRLTGLSVQNAADDADWFSMRYNHNTGEIYSESNGLGEIWTAGALPFIDGWVRIYMTGRFTTTGISTRLSVYQAPGPTFDPADGGGIPSYGGNSSSGVYMWNGQYEEGYFTTPTAPIFVPSTTPVTRAADIITQSVGSRSADAAQITGTDFSDWYNPLEGTFVVRAQRKENVQANGRMFSVNDGFQNELMEVLYSTAGSGTRGNVRVGGAQTALLEGGSDLVNPTSYALAYQENNVGYSGNGSEADTDFDTPIPTVDQIWFGARPGFDAYLNGYVNRFLYFSNRLPNELIQNLSAQVIP